MIKELREFTPEGLDFFSRWIDEAQPGQFFPNDVLESGIMTSAFGNDIGLNIKSRFETRFEFGKYLTEVLSVHSPEELLSERSDSMWAWLAACFFEQLSAKRVLKAPHYIVARRGFKASLEYRQMPRNSFMMYQLHGENAAVALNYKMHVFGQNAEDFGSRAFLAEHREFIALANSLYTNQEGFKKGASARAKRPDKRPMGDKTGYGAVQRLIKTLRRLDLTYDTLGMTQQDLLEILPREFDTFKS